MELLSESDRSMARSLLNQNPRLTYILESALFDGSHQRHDRQIRVSREPNSLVMRSLFGGINVVYVYGELTSQDFDWISTLPEQCEIHCESIHRGQICSSCLAARIVATDLVAYYRMTKRNEAPTPCGPQKIENRHLPEVSEFIRKYNDDPIDYPGMFELPAFGIWEDGKLVSMAGTLYINESAQSCQIGGFLTAPAFRGKGFASSLGKTLLHHLSSMGIDTIRLEVYSQNATARRLYESLGFELENESPMIVLSRV